MKDDYEEINWSEYCYKRKIMMTKFGGLIRHGLLEG